VQGVIFPVANVATSCHYHQISQALELPLKNNGDDNTDHYQNAISLLDAKTISWTSKTPGETLSSLSWNKSRYRLSTLSSPSTRISNNGNAPYPGSPTLYPEWMEGYWAVNYKFNGASFPQGRNIVSLRTAGAGIGTCLSLPNVGYSTPTHAAHFIKSEMIMDMQNKTSLSVHEDLAYNLPRKFEAFWSQSKILSVQTNGHPVTGGVNDNGKEQHPPPIMLSPKCFVTGDGCTPKENPNLHQPSTRIAMDFDGPTRRNGRLTQSVDVSLIDNYGGLLSGDNAHYASVKTYSQLNVNQELQTFYKEIASLERIKNQSDHIVVGKVRVAAFLPKYIQEYDAENNADYDENAAVAFYDYKIFMKKIDEVEAASL